MVDLITTSLPTQNGHNGIILDDLQGTPHYEI